jgi:hypothetical protein
MIASMKATDLQKDKLITRLKRANLALHGSPPRRQKRRLEDDDNEDKEAMGEVVLGEEGEEEEEEEEEQPVVPSQTSHDTASTAAAATSHNTALTAAAVATLVPALPVWEFNRVQLTKLTPSKVTVTTELERLVPILMQKQDRAQTEGTSLSKRALFDPINKYFIGCNEHFGSKDASKYRDAMKLIAISMSNAEWNRLIVIGRKSADVTSGGNDRPMRDLVSVIKKNTMDTLKRLQTDHLGLARKSRATEGIRALGDNERAVFNVALKGKAIAEQEEWMIEKLGERRQSGEQQSLVAAFRSDKA